MRNTTQKNVILIGAAVILVSIFVYAVLNYFPRSSAKPVSILVEGQPTIGNADAPVRAVVFEEPTCIGCKHFTLTVYPEIKKEFIDTGLVRYTLIPVSFLPGSMSVAVGWLCVFEESTLKSNVDLFFDRVDETYSRLEYEGKESPAHDSLSGECKNKEAFRKKIKNNTAYAMKLMNREISTPALYIDGVPVDGLSRSKVRKAIEKALKNKEKESPTNKPV